MPAADRRVGPVRRALVLALVVSAVLSARAAAAHAVGLSRGEYVARGRSLQVAVTLARKDAETFASASSMAGQIRVSSAGSACGLGDCRFVDAPPDGVTLQARYECPTLPTAVDVDAAFLADLPFGHRHLVRGISGQASPLDDVLMRDRRSFSLRAAPATVEPRRPSLARAVPLVRMGVEHILTGYDHLLFLLGLVLASRGLRTLLGAVTAFTAAHSATLAAAALGWWAPPPAVVEPLIAASIAYVGLENLFLRSPSGRWRLAFPFGLVHGFGFAGALREVHFARESMPLVLAAFNVGVELGQLAILAAVVPILFAMRRRSWFGHRGFVALSGAVAATGLVWTLARVFGGST
jgi:hypothetical protein